MKYVWMVAVLVCVVLTSSAFAQLATPRAMGMGNAATAVADDAGAWFQNPAGLAGLNVAAPEGKDWANDVIGAYADYGDTGFGVTWSGFQPAKGQGFGAGYVDAGDTKYLGAGFGMNWKDSPLAWGVNVLRNDPDAGSSDTLFNIGLLYKAARTDAAPVRVALVVNDVTDETNNGPWFDLAVAWPATDKLLIALDAIDVTDEFDSTFNFGAEYVCGATNEWALRAGSNDSDLTLGAGYKFGNNWRADFGWADTAGDSVWTVGAGLNF